jgi:superfamily II DNA/RNA helicase
MPAEKTRTLTRDVTFASLGVPAPLITVLDADGISTPFPIQAAALPDALAGCDILGRAQTGSGKTLGFSLPLVTRLAGGRTASGRPRGLVLVPTRELATQVHAVLKPLAKAMGLWVATIYGGVSQGPQVAALRRRTDIVVATPGRLADLIGQGHCDLSDVEVTVIDEADQMADLGFLPIVRRLLEATPPGGQRLLFSATLDSAIDVLARRFLTDPARHSVDENSSPAEIEHHVITIEATYRLEVIAALAGGEKRSLVFTRTKHGAERLARQLTAAGIPAAELHGNLRQGARSRNLAAFGSGAVRVMVATDIAARGIHVDGIDLVIHADPPAEHKAYVHRSGRTARGGADGVVVTVQTAAQAREVRSLMRKAGVTPQVASADPDSELLREIAGPPVPRVRLLKSVTELVKPTERLSGRPDSGKPSGRKPRNGPLSGTRRDGTGRRRKPHTAGTEQPAAKEQPRGVRAFEERAERRERPERWERPERLQRPEPVRPERSQRWQERPGRPERWQERPGRPERAKRTDRFEQRERPARPRRTWADRTGPMAPADRALRGRSEWAPAERPRGGRDGRAAGSRLSRGNGRPEQAGGHWGGATVRSGYAGGRSAAGKRRDSGKGRRT